MYAEAWVCPQCPYPSNGHAFCAGCGAPQPSAWATQAPDEPATIYLLPTTKKWGAGRQLAKAVIRFIVLGIIVQAGTYALTVSRLLEPADSIRLTLGVSVGVYVLVVVFGGLSWFDTGVSPVLARGKPLAGAAIGLATGAAMAAAVVTVRSIAVGDLAGSPALSLLVSEGTWTRIAAAVGIYVVAAPVVEELLFRGLLQQSLRHRHVLTAMGVSALLFALWHTAPLMIPYYLTAGLVLGGLYRARGLVAAVLAHAAFNGILVAVAIVLTVGADHVVASPNVRVEVPKAWQRNADGESASVDLALIGPSGSSVKFEHADAALGAADRTDSLVAALAAGRLTEPDVEVVPGTARPVTIGTEHAAQADVTINRQGGRMVVLARRDRVWGVLFMDGGSARAAHDFPAILRSARLR